MVRVNIFDVQVYIYKKEDMVYIRTITIVLLLYVAARFFFGRLVSVHEEGEFQIFNFGLRSKLDAPSNNTQHTLY